MHSRLTVLTGVGLAYRGVGLRHLLAPRGPTGDGPRLAIELDPHSARAGACACCHAEHRVDRLAGDHAYLLGLYLGDGCIADRLTASRSTPFGAPAPACLHSTEQG